MNAIYIIPYYENKSKCYKDIIVVDSYVPDLQNMLKQVNYKSPSNYNEYGNNCNCSNSCLYAFKSINNNCELMCTNEIPILYTKFLEMNIQIDTKITKMMNHHKLNNKKLLCYIKLNNTI